MPTRKQKRPDRLGYGSGKRFKTMSNLDKNLSNSDDDFDPGASLEAEWTYPLEDNSDDKPGMGESNKDKREDDLRVDSITIKALKEQYGKLSSKQ